MNFLQQQNKLSRILGDSNTTTDDQWPLADRLFELNRGSIKFSIETKSVLRRVDGTVASQKISLPSDYAGMHALVINKKVVTGEDEMPLQDYGRYIDSGDDKYYFWVDSSGSTTRAINLISSNTDGQSYKLFYFAKPTVELSADTDESIIEDQYREASVYYAASQLLPQAGKTELAAYYEGEYRKFVARASFEIEKKVNSVVKAFPDITGNSVYDSDVQGVGEQIGGIW